MQLCKRALQKKAPQIEAHMDVFSNSGLPQPSKWPLYYLAGPKSREWGKFHPQYTNVKVDSLIPY